jgi:hypothetical protein
MAQWSHELAPRPQAQLRRHFIRYIPDDILVDRFGIPKFLNERF